MKKQFLGFLLRWILMSFGLWIASRVLSSSFNDTGATTSTFLVAGLLLSLANTLLKPIVVVLALPAILLTLGLFMLIVNGFMVYVALKLAPGVDVTFWGAVITGIIISVINYAITGIIDYKEHYDEETVRS